MEIKVKLSEIVNATSALNDLASQRLIARAGLQIGRALKVITGELEVYEKSRQQLIEKHSGVANPQTNQFEFKDGVKFAEEFKDLLDTEITLSVDKIKVSDLADCKPAVATMMQLAWLIEDDAKPA